MKASLLIPSLNSQAVFYPKAKTALLTVKMAKGTLVLLLVSLLYISGTARSATPARSSASASNFIKDSCRTTTYPALCVESLSAYATTIQQSPRQLTETALSVSLDRAESTKTFIYRLTKFKGMKAREMEAVKDCVEEINDTVDRLSKSFKELKNMGESKGKEYQWHISNVETWVSAALTDENTCLDGFSGKALNGKLKSSIKARIVNVAQVTSNALALINKFASKN